MERILVKFIKALRTSQVRISTAETLDALNTLQLVGFKNRALLKHSLALTLAKTPDEKAIFDDCFERFFSTDSLTERNNSSSADADGSSSSTEPQALAGPGAELSSSLGQMLMEQEQAELEMAIMQAANTIRLHQISLFTQKGPYTQRMLEQMGLDELQEEIRDLARNENTELQQLAVIMQNKRDGLRQQIYDYVEQQFLLHADVNGRELREEILRKVKLSNIEHHYFHDIQQLVLRMAKKLVAVHSRRKKVFKRGQLNMSRTLRHNMAYDGNIVELHWKAVKVDRPKVFAICDVSGSVSNYSRFMLMFLYSLEAVMPKVRAFAFSSSLGEVTDLFDHHGIDAAIGITLHDYGGGSTDYGQAFIDFKRLCLDDIDNRSTIIILGDGRNNYGNPQAEILQQLYERSKRVIWLNPEPKNFWHTGDAEIRRYSAYCHQLVHCNTLQHLERVVDGLLRHNA